MTIEPEYISLIHAEIDGANPPHESERLRRYIDSNPEARHELDRLRRLAETLARVEAVKPPAGLRREIRSALPASRASVKPGRIARPAAASTLRYGYALAAGMILGVLGFHWATTGILWPPTLDTSKAAGTISRGASDPGPLQEIDLALPGATGKAILRQGDPGHIVEIDVDSEAPVEVSVSYDPGRVVFRGFIQEISAATGMSVAEDGLSWTQRGHHRVRVLVAGRRGEQATVNVRLVGPGGRVQEATLHLPK